MTNPDNTAPTNGLEKLGRTLTDLRNEEAAERLTQQKRKDLLLSVWKRLQPTLKQAIGQINFVLAEHGYERICGCDEPEFFGDDDCTAYGDEFHIADIWDSNFPIVVTDEQIFIGGTAGWNEGYTILLQDISAEALTNAISDIVGYLITDKESRLT